MEAATTIYDLLGILSHQCLFLADIKYRYWAVNIYPDSRHYLAFYILEFSQVQTTCMPQRASTLAFTFDKFMNIVFGLIL